MLSEIENGRFEVLTAVFAELPGLGCDTWSLGECFPTSSTNAVPSNSKGPFEFEGLNAPKLKTFTQYRQTL